MQNFGRELLAVRWPTNVELWVRAMATTYVVAKIGCFQAMAATGSWTGVRSQGPKNADCIAAGSTADPNAIRTLLGLPQINK